MNLVMQGSETLNQVQFRINSSRGNGWCDVKISNSDIICLSSIGNYFAYCILVKLLKKSYKLNLHRKKVRCMFISQKKVFVNLEFLQKLFS